MAEKKFPALRDDLDEIMSSPAMPSALKEFLSIGEDVEDLFTRSELNDREIRLLTIVLYKAERFRLPILGNFARYFLALKISRNRKGRLEFLQGVTGMIAPALMAERRKEGEKR